MIGYTEIGAENGAQESLQRNRNSLFNRAKVHFKNHRGKYGVCTGVSIAIIGTALSFAFIENTTEKVVLSTLSVLMGGLVGITIGGKIHEIDAGMGGFNYLPY